jgi:hypothetical protein
MVARLHPARLARLSAEIRHSLESRGLRRCVVSAESSTGLVGHFGRLRQVGAGKPHRSADYRCGCHHRQGVQVADAIYHSRDTVVLTAMAVAQATVSLAAYGLSAAAFTIRAPTPQGAVSGGHSGACDCVR